MTPRADSRDSRAVAALFPTSNASDAVSVPRPNSLLASRCLSVFCSENGLKSDRRSMVSAPVS